MGCCVQNVSFQQQALIPSCCGAVIPATLSLASHLDRLNNGHCSSIPGTCHVLSAWPNMVERLWRLGQESEVPLAICWFLLALHLRPLVRRLCHISCSWWEAPLEGTCWSQVSYNPERVERCRCPRRAVLPEGFSSGLVGYFWRRLGGQSLSQGWHRWRQPVEAISADNLTSGPLWAALTAGPEEEMKQRCC